MSKPAISLELWAEPGSGTDAVRVQYRFAHGPAYTSGCRCMLETAREILELFGDGRIEVTDLRVSEGGAACH